MPWGSEDEVQDPIAGHGSETRLVTLTYASGFFAFITLEPTKTFWGEGELIEIHIRIRNTGTVEAKATIKVYDDATGELITTLITSSLAPWSLFEPWEWNNPSFTDYSLKMPAHDWTLRFEMTP